MVLVEIQGSCSVFPWIRVFESMEFRCTYQVSMLRGKISENQGDITWSICHVLQTVQAVGMFGFVAS